MAHRSTNQTQKESGAPRALVWLVVGMGLALIGGSALLIGKIINKSSDCSLQALVLPEGARIIGGDSKQLLVLLEDDQSGQRLQRYELCRGTLAGEVSVKRE